MGSFWTYTIAGNGWKQSDINCDIATQWEPPKQQLGCDRGGKKRTKSRHRLSGLRGNSKFDVGYSKSCKTLFNQWIRIFKNNLIQVKTRLKRWKTRRTQAIISPSQIWDRVKRPHKTGVYWIVSNLTIHKWWIRNNQPTATKQEKTSIVTCLRRF